VDVRVVAATNVDPLEAVRDGKLREDLYYRLNVFGMSLPPLRDRKDDLPLLTDAFVREASERNHRAVGGVSDQVVATFKAHSWPGNVRELRNVIERATIVAKGSQIELNDLPPLEGVAADGAHGDRDGLVAGMTVADAEWRLIEITLEHTNNNKTKAAEMLGISLKTLHNKLNRHAT
jgi:transcriptional regulator with PAS, ATPase and Fis domain